MGSIVPMRMIWLASGVTTKLVEGSHLVSATIWVALAVSGVRWIVAVLAISDTEHKRLYP